MDILPKAIYSFKVIPIKIPMTFFIELEKIIQQYIWNHERPTVDKEILRTKEQSRRQNPPTFRQYYKAIVIKTELLAKIRHVDQYNTVESPEINPQSYGHLNFEKGNNGKKTVSLASDVEISGTTTCKSMKQKHIFTLYTKINSKWLRNLNISEDTMNLLKKITGKTFYNINHSNVFLGQSSKTIDIKAKINQCDLIKLISFCFQRQP